MAVTIGVICRLARGGCIVARGLFHLILYRSKSLRILGSIRRCTQVVPQIRWPDPAVGFRDGRRYRLGELAP
jgi:hypothetical protein